MARRIGTFTKPNISLIGKVSIGKNLYTNWSTRNKKDKQGKSEKGKDQKKQQELPKNAEDATSEKDLKQKAESEKNTSNTADENKKQNDSGDGENKWYIWSVKSDMLKNYFKVTDVSKSASVRMIQHPVEDGSVKHDNKAEDPKKCTVKGYVSGISGENIESISKKINTVFDKILAERNIEKSVVKVYGKITEKPMSFHLLNYTCRASSDKYDAFDYDLQMQELIIGKNATTVQSATNSDSQSKGSKGK